MSQAQRDLNRAVETGNSDNREFAERQLASEAQQKKNAKLLKKLKR